MSLRIVLLLFALMLATGAGAEPESGPYPVEARAIWMDASSMPKDDAGIERLVEQMHRANLNLILPEVFRRGYTIYPGRLTTQDPTFPAGFDPLASLIRHSHKRGIEVHPWVWVFRQGYTDNKGPILTAHPEWTAKNKLGEELSVNGGYWVCPADSAARNYLSAVFRDLVSRYKVDGLHLDYVRFENQDPVPYCYNDTCRTSFQRQHGIDPMDIDPLTPNQIRWHLWRERQVNTFVQQVAAEARRTRPGIKVSAAVGGDPVNARTNLLQNWTNWAENRWLDFITPMLYTADSARFNKLMSVGLEAVDHKTLILPGIGVINHKTPEPTLEQIRLSRDYGTLGQVYFATVYFKEPWQEALRAGPYASPAIVPFRNPAAALAALERHSPGSQQVEAMRRYLAYAPTGYVPPASPPIFIPASPLPLGEVDVPQAQGPIKIDGALSEGDWQSAGLAPIAHANFGDPAPVRTEARLLYDDSHLYIAFTSEEPEMDKIKAAVEKRDGPTFYDDSIEIFLDPPGRGMNYFHLSANTLGTVFDQQGYNTGWNPEWQVAVSKSENGWIVEAAIPFAALKTSAPSAGIKWRGNLGRSRWATGQPEYLIWSVPYGGFHRAERFGWINFR